MRHVFVLLVVLVAAASPASAQWLGTPTDAIRRAVDRARAVPGDTRLRVTAGDTVMRGRYLGMRGDTLLLYTGYDVPARIAARDVRGLEVVTYRRGAWTAQGLSFGAISGAAMGATLSALNPCDYCFSPGWGGVAGGIVGAVLGSIVGFTIGSFREYWRPVYP